MTVKPVNAESKDPKVPAIRGRNDGAGGFGVWGSCDSGNGVRGESIGSRGVAGLSQTYHGVWGHSVENVGVAGESDKMSGVLGVPHDPKGSGVMGTNDQGGDGVVGNGRRGVVGISLTYQGVYGYSQKNAGVVGESDELDGVYGVSNNASTAGVSGHNTRGGLAGYFDGHVTINGDINCTQGADCAEDFDVIGTLEVEPGTVMVLGEGGALSESRRAYDKRVAGVVSGAGDYQPAIVLDKRAGPGNRQPIALMGKVYCKVDARLGAIEIGDLLTTSSTPGHAMRTDDPLQAFGAVIGKALQPLASGTGLIAILVARQ